MSAGEEIRITLTQEGSYSFRLDFHEHGIPDLLTDEPEPLGEGLGPNPSRLLLASLGNCLAASLVFAMRKFHNEPGSIRAEVSARMVRNEQGRWRIPRAQVQLHLAEGGGVHKHLERILEQFESFCVVTQSVREGIEVDVSVHDMDGNMLLGDKSFEAGA
jgi:uncharacterized OsmC-like protein